MRAEGNPQHPYFPPLPAGTILKPPRVVVSGCTVLAQDKFMYKACEHMWVQWPQLSAMIHPHLQSDYIGHVVEA